MSLITSQFLFDSHFNSTLGTEKYQAADDHKKIELDHKLLKNHLNKLQKQESFIKKLQKTTQKRAEDLLKQKEERISFLHDQFLYKQQKFKNEEDLRYRLNDKNAKKREKMKQVTDEMLRNKWGLASRIRGEKEMNDEMFAKYKELVSTQKSKNASFSREVKMKLVGERSKSNLVYRNSLREEYVKAIDRHKNEFLRVLEEKTEMIKKEGEILERISNTKNMQLKILEGIKNIQHIRSFSQTDHY